MLVMIGITAVVLFFLLWRLGVFDELAVQSRLRRSGQTKPQEKLLRRGVDHQNKRLEVFEEFFDELSDEDEIN
jgi:hypothetical protein